MSHTNPSFFAFLVAMLIPIITTKVAEADAIDIWIARWLRVRQCDLLKRYNCDPRRLYEIWEETRFAGTRAKALAVFRERHPSLLDRVDPGAHRRIPTRSIHPDQLSLF